MAYALERKIRDLGYDVETISWLPDEVKNPWKLSIIKKTGLIHYLLRLGYFSVFILPRNKSFSALRSRMQTSKQIYEDRTLPSISDYYDKIVIGGDQLWNCKVNYYNRNNFLPFIEEERRKVVYAASLALSELPPENAEAFKTLASKFGYITTREQRGQEIVEEAIGKPAPRVIDSAFFLSEAEWSKLAEPIKGVTKKFLFVYQVQSDVSLINFAQKMAKKHNLQIVYCPFPLKKQIACKRFPYMSPEQWIWCVKNAEYVVTDAFHGTVFSIIFKKPFATEISNYGSDTSSRITNILKIFDMENRLLQGMDCPGFEKPMNRAEIEAVIQEENKQAMIHLKKMLDL